MSNSISIIEEFTKSKLTDEKMNEDGLFYDDNFVVVIDGVTSKSKKQYDGFTGGALAKETIRQTFASFNGNENIEYIINEMQKEINKVVSKSKIQGIAASVIIYSKKYDMIWSIGDCKCLVDGKLYDDKNELEEIAIQARKMVIHALLLNGYTEDQLLQNDLSREAIMPLLKLQSNFANVNDKYGYAILNGDIEKNQYIIDNVYKISIKDAREVVMSSDGYFNLYNTLEKTEMQLAIDLKNDPLCYKKNFATKGKYFGADSFDDRTYIRFEIN